MRATTDQQLTLKFAQSIKARLIDPLDEGWAPICQRHLVARDEGGRPLATLENVGDDVYGAQVPHRQHLQATHLSTSPQSNVLYVELWQLPKGRAVVGLMKWQAGQGPIASCSSGPNQACSLLPTLSVGGMRGMCSTTRATRTAHHDTATATDSASVAEYSASSRDG